MAEYVVVRTMPEVMGGVDRVEAVLIRDDREMVILGDTGIAEDLRERVKPGDEFLDLLHGMTYFKIAGPFEIADMTARQAARSFPI